MSDASSTEATKSSTPRRRIVETASRLFDRYGFQAVGVDRIVAESGVAKMTLYRNFSSKDELIVEYLERSAGAFWKWFEAAAGRETDPKVKLLAVFEDLESRCSGGACRGCPFQSAAAEYPDTEHPVNRAARKHKEAVRCRIERMVEEAGLQAAVAAAAQLTLLMEGAWAAVRTFGSDSQAREVSAAARLIVEGQRYLQALATR